METRTELCLRRASEWDLEAEKAEKTGDVGEAEYCRQQAAMQRIYANTPGPQRVSYGRRMEFPFLKGKK